MGHVSTDVMVARRDEVLERLAALAKADARIAGLWLQGSLAKGTSDPFSDIDAVLSVDDNAFDAVFAERAALLTKLGGAYAWADGQFPGLVHALLVGGVKLDLLFERMSGAGAQKRQAVRIVHDRGDLADWLTTGWEAPRPFISHVIGIIIRMTRQGATWPLRLLNRGRWSTLAMVELDLINAQVAQLMALQADPANFYVVPFSLSRHLRPDQQKMLDGLTARAMEACLRQDAAALKAVHLDIYDALVREGRAACRALGCEYPLAEESERDLRNLLEREWPL